MKELLTDVEEGINLSYVAFYSEFHKRKDVKNVPISQILCYILEVLFVLSRFTS